MWVWLPVRQLILEQIYDYNLNDFNLFTILSGGYEYRLVQATENGRPRELRNQFFKEYYLKVGFYPQGVPNGMGTQVVNTFHCDLQPAGLKQWKAVKRSCVSTYVASPKEELFYFSILMSGILTISDDFKNLTFTQTDKDYNATLFFELKDFNDELYYNNEFDLWVDSSTSLLLVEGINNCLLIFDLLGWSIGMQRSLN